MIDTSQPIRRPNFPDPSNLPPGLGYAVNIHWKSALIRQAGSGRAFVGAAPSACCASVTAHGATQIWWRVAELNRQVMRLLGIQRPPRYVLTVRLSKSMRSIRTRAIVPPGN